MKNYEEAEIEVIKFNSEDIIATSECGSILEDMPE